MDVAEVLIELFGRIDGHVTDIVEGLDHAALMWAPGSGRNHIGWLVWHLTRVQDSHVAEIMEVPQIWEGGGFAARFGLRPDPDDHGYGHTPEQVAGVRPDGWEALADYHRAVSERTRGFLRTLDPAHLDRIVDESWDPPVTMGVRLVSVADDDIQHAGQAAYLRGLYGER
jgi:hypothetical protein